MTIFNGRDLANIPASRFKSSAAGSVTNVVAATAHANAPDDIPALAVGDVVAFDTFLAVTRAAPDGARLSFRQCLASEDLVADGVEITYVDVFDSGIVHVAGHLYARTDGGAAQVDVAGVVSLGGGIAPSVAPALAAVVVLNVSAEWQLGWVLTPLGTWGAGSTSTCKHVMGYVNNERIP